MFCYISLCICICLSEWGMPIDGSSSIICYCLWEHLGIFFLNLPDCETDFFFCFILFCSINQCLIYTTQGKPLLLLFGIPQLKAIKFSVTKLGLLVECQVPSRATLSLPFSVGWGREYKMDKQKDRQVYSLLPTSEGCSATSQKAGLQLQKANIVK